jgi:hypothetical protein
MQKSIAVLLMAMAALSCRHRKEDVASSRSTPSIATSTSDAPLVGHTRKVDGDKSAPKNLGPEIGTDFPTPGAIINVPALVGRSKERVEGVIGEAEDKQKSIYRVSGQPVHVYYENGRAVWFEMAVPWPVLNAVDALRLFSVDLLNVEPQQESDNQAVYTVEFSGVELNGSTITKLNAVAAKPQTAPEWTDIGAGIRRPIF